MRHNRKKINLTIGEKSLIVRQIHYFWLWTLKKPRRLIFVTFSELENSVTKMRNVTKVSVTKMSGGSIWIKGKPFFLNHWFEIIRLKQVQKLGVRTQKHGKVGTLANKKLKIQRKKCYVICGRNEVCFAIREDFRGMGSLLAKLIPIFE